MMVFIEPPISMLFAGTKESCAFHELRGIGIPEARTGRLSKPHPADEAFGLFTGDKFNYLV